MLRASPAWCCATRWPASGCARSPRRAPEPAGYGTLGGLHASTHLLQLDACTKCGRCHEACPANATGRPLSPRDVILELREQAQRRQDRAGSAACSARCRRHGRQLGLPGSWARTACAPRRSGRACSATRASRPARWGSSRRRSSTSCAGAWSRRASSTPTCRRAPGDPQVGQLVRREPAQARALDGRAGLRGQGRAQGAGRRAVVRRRLRVVRSPLAAGHAHDRPAAARGRRRLRDPLRRRAQRGQRRAPGRGGGPVRVLAEQNIATLSECEFNRIVTSDPHSLNTLRNEYPELGGTGR